MSVRPLDPVAMLEFLARTRPDDIAYGYRAEPSGIDTILTYAGLHRRACDLAALLATKAPPGSRALLAFPAPLDFIVAYLACLRSGIVGVPMYAPSPRRDTILTRIADDAGISLMLTTTRCAALRPPALRAETVCVDAVPEGIGGGDRPVACGPDAPAHIQYTSGSTGFPKGVVVTRGNIIAEFAAASRRYGTGPNDVIVSWLPHFHDFGLIFGTLHALLAGIPAWLMAPASFVQDPARWLALIAEKRGTFSASPNFGYEHCLRRVPPERVAGLDLSAWRMVLNGAEPIRESAIAGFLDLLAPAGFRPGAMHIAYGLAEATLVVSTRPWAAPANMVALDAAALSLGHALPAREGHPAWRVVDCGAPIDGVAVAVLDEEGDLADEGEIGELAVRGESVCLRNWASTPARSAAAEPDGARYRRTGDLGFLRGGHLFMTGRRADVITIDGLSHPPFEIEAAVERASAAVKPGHVAAFAWPTGPAAADAAAGARAVVVVAEIVRDRGVSILDLPPLLRGAIARDLEIPVHDVVIVAPGTLPKTTSGKVRRRECLRLYRSGELARLDTCLDTLPAAIEASADGLAHRARDVLAAIRDWHAARPEPRGRLRAGRTLASLSPGATGEAALADAIAPALHVPAERIALTPDRPLIELALALAEDVAMSGIPVPTPRQTA